MFNYVVRVGKTNTDNIFYDINLEVASYLPHANKIDASDTTTSKDSVSQRNKTVNSNYMQNGEIRPSA